MVEKKGPSRQLPRFRSASMLLVIVSYLSHYITHHCGSAKSLQKTEGYLLFATGSATSTITIDRRERVKYVVAP